MQPKSIPKMRTVLSPPTGTAELDIALYGGGGKADPGKVADKLEEIDASDGGLQLGGGEAAISVSLDSSSAPIGAIVGGIFAALVVCFGLCLGCVLYKRRQRLPDGTLRNRRNSVLISSGNANGKKAKTTTGTPGYQMAIKDHALLGANQA